MSVTYASGPARPRRSSCPIGKRADCRRRPAPTSGLPGPVGRGDDHWRRRDVGEVVRGDKGRRAAAVATVMFTVPAAAGLVAVICVPAGLIAKLVARFVPKYTAVAPVKPVPVIVTVVPPATGPDAGLTPLIVGGDVSELVELGNNRIAGCGIDDDVHGSLARRRDGDDLGTSIDSIILGDLENLPASCRSRPPLRQRGLVR